MILTRAVAFSGRGLHGGRQVRCVVMPRERGDGPGFRLGGRDVPLGDLEAAGAQRSTSLCDPRSGERVGSVEHLLAALAGIGLWDVTVDPGGEEIPALDGSALPFAEELTRACRGSPPRPPLVPRRRVRVTSGRSELEAVPADRLVLEVTVDFPHPAVGSQSFVWEAGRADFLEQLAPARTFGFIEEVAGLRERGLAAGGSLDCALVYGPDGAINPGGERFDNEPARHKTLDLLGDLALLARPLAARVRAHRPSHELNHRLVGAILGTL